MSSDISLAPEQEAFRQEVRRFLAGGWTGVDPDSRDQQAFVKQAIEAGYLFRNVPKIYGGAEQAPDPIRAHIIAEEWRRARAPGPPGGANVNILVPTLLAAASDWQKEMFIPKTLTGEYRWTQGYSEPGAGSDLAAVRTRAVLDGDEWVIDGQKIWTSLAHQATHMYALVRTEPDAPKHDGITYMLLRMDQPGITVRPLRQINGDATFNEVFLDGARTPKEWIVGERGKGWLVSRTTLNFERNSVGGAEASAKLLEQILRLARTTDLEGRPAIEDAFVRDELVRIQAMVTAHRLAGFRQLMNDACGRPISPAAGAYNKLYGSMIAERIAKVARTIMGSHILVEEGRGPSIWLKQYFNSIAAQIGGGASNMQRNSIAERDLGLPRDQVG